MVRPRVYIIIVNWNGWKDTVECLESLKKVIYPNFKIVLVDNGSVDDSISNFQFIISKPDSKIILIENKNNLGFAGGNNVGIKYALQNDADHVLLLNNDTIVDENFLNKLIETGEGNKDFGILGPKIYYHDEPKKIWYDGGKINWFTGNSHLNIGKIETTEDNQPKTTEFVSGCCLLIRREAIEKIGLLFEPFFLYYEDVDWCLRLRKAGYGCVVVPQAKIWHKVSRSTKMLGNPIFHYYNHRNVLLLARRNRPVFFYFVMIPWSMWKFLKQIIKLVFIPSAKPVSLAIITGIKDFYRGNFGQESIV